MKFWGYKSFAIFALMFGGAGAALAQFAPPPGTGPGLNETVEAIESAGISTRILYLTAHPDDESAAVLTYLARGLHADVALLSLTRGEGGQNALGPEQAPQLGLIRTQELLAATRGYGVKLFFTSARDFGFSKTSEEAEKMWGDQVLADIVRVIRTFRPNVVINNFGGVHSGHGHHQAAGVWTPKAVQLAADPSYRLSSDAARLKELSSGVITEDFEKPWGGKDHPVQVLDVDRNGGAAANPARLEVPVDEVSPLWGKTWREIGIDAFANHRTQGISAFLGGSFFHRPIGLVSENGEKLDAALLAQPLHMLGGDAGSDPGAPCPQTAFFCPVLKQAESNLAKARQDALSLNWQQAASEIASAAKEIISLYPGGGHAAHWVAGDPFLADLHREQRRLDRALALAAGLETVAEADRSEVVIGEPFSVTTESRCRKEAGCELGKLDLTLRGEANVVADKADESKGKKFKVIVNQRAPESGGWERQQPEPAALATARQEVTVGGYPFIVDQPVTHIAATSTRTDRVAVRVVPPYTLALEPDQNVQLLARPKQSFDVLLRVHSYATKDGKIDAGVTVPAGWTAGSPVALQFSGAGYQYAKVKVTPPENLGRGTFLVKAFAQREKETFATALTPLPSMPTLLWSEPAQCRVFAFDAVVPRGLHIGYISAESEPIPQALERLGIRVEMLDAAALAFGDLTRFDAVVVGVRAYELRSELAGANQRLLDYVSNGGTLVVQYQRDFAWDKFRYAPYPAKISSDKPNSPLPRITDEQSPVKFLNPDDALLNAPNKITAEDFNGWIQERGLYFWSQFDTKYTPLLAMSDPGEPELNGGLVYARLGKGTYIYTGLAFFRQIPEGVPGAYRLFVNLLSASREAGTNPAQAPASPAKTENR
ncbi:MAG: PIG-L family deacetylase [Acidobacteriota bacterium]|nr:PIG-L family deacetylase [Acidobacteriota bacterium]